MSLGCGGKLRMVFVIINIDIFLLGIVELIVGVQALSNVSNINTDHITPLLDSIKMGSIQAGSMVNTLSIITIVIGVLILVVAGLGLIEVFCQKRWMLVTYAISILILLVMKIVIIALWLTMKNKVDNQEMDFFEDKPVFKPPETLAAVTMETPKSIEFFSQDISCPVGGCSPALARIPHQGKVTTPLDGKAPSQHS